MQLYEELSSTYTYLVACEDTGQAALIDPVYPTAERDLQIINNLGLKLIYSIDTHIHADHITAARRLKQLAGCEIIYPAAANCECADTGAEEGKPIRIGGVWIEPIYTPGHTDDHHAYKIGDRLLTGDALLIDGCGRTDFQNGNPDHLYESVREKLFSLPGDTLVYPAHDYNHRHVSSISQERERNPRLGGDTTIEEFRKIMSNLDLAYPKFIDHAVPGNKLCGVCPDDLPNKYKQYCHQMSESPQG